MFVNGSGPSLRANLQHSSKYCNVFLAFSVFILYSGLANRGPYDLGCCISLLKMKILNCNLFFVFLFIFFPFLPLACADFPQHCSRCCCCCCCFVCCNVASFVFNKFNCIMQHLPLPLPPSSSSSSSSRI